jgi:hypothetical protein
MQSFNDVLFSSNFRLVSTYKYDVGNCLFDFIFYLLKSSLTSLQIKENSMQYLMFDIKYTKKHKNVVLGNWTQVFYMIYIMMKFPMNTNTLKKCPKVLPLMAYWGDFTTIFWIVEYLQWPIYVWNKNSNRIV